MTLDTCALIENEAGDERLAVISIGLLGGIDNVVFQDNTTRCDTGEYGYMNNSAVGRWELILSWNTLGPYGR